MGEVVNLAGVDISHPSRRNGWGVGVRWEW